MISQCETSASRANAKRPTHLARHQRCASTVECDTFAEKVSLRWNAWNTETCPEEQTRQKECCHGAYQRRELLDAQLRHVTLDTGKRRTQFQLCHIRHIQQSLVHVPRKCQQTFPFWWFAVIKALAVESFRISSNVFPVLDRAAPLLAASCPFFPPFLPLPLFALTFLPPKLIFPWLPDSLKGLFESVSCVPCPL